ncbi:MAG: choice-of-anchor O protein [Desulfobacteria bacterium]
MRTRKLYGVLMFFVLAGSLAFATGNSCPDSAYAEVAHAYGGPGRLDTTLYAGQTIDAGTVSVWNGRENLKIRIEPSGEWSISEVHVFVGTGEVPTVNGNPIPGKFPYKKEFSSPVLKDTTVVHLSDDMSFSWGEPWEDQRIQNIAVHVDLVMLDENGEVSAEEGAWAFGPNEFEGSQWGWWFNYQMAHPKRGHFIDSPVKGLSFQTGTFDGLTDESGGFDYFPGEHVALAIGSVHLGNPLAGHKISPLDIFESADTDDPRVINMARLLQSLDADASPKQGINITPEVAACLVQTVGSTSLDFSDDAQIESVIQGTILCAPPGLVAVTAEDAKANLDRSLDSNMFRKNVSRTPELASAKAKLNIMGVWLPALRANGDPAVYTDEDGAEQPGIPYYDADGNLIRTEPEAKPIVAIYCDEVETGAHDVFASISRDDGNTWKRKNISRMADKSSFTLANGQLYYGHCKKPVFQVKGNKILVAWTTKFARGGKPTYAITTTTGIVDDPLTLKDETSYVFDDPYYADDIWGVSGPQRSVDYTDQGYPEVGEVPYSAVWVARAVIATQADVDNGLGTFVGDIVWFKPERLTSGRRDANQNFCGGADGAGFAVTWQEDPEGLRPGEAKGPGPGWGGATTNHKTDIWYSYITWTDFATVDTNFVSGGDPEHNDPDFIGRPKALVPMSLPVRVSDNDVVNTHNMWIELDGNGLPVLDVEGNVIPTPNPYPPSDDADGSHRYGYLVEGLWNWDGNLHYEAELLEEGESNPDWTEGSGTLYQFLNQKDELKTVVVTADGRALDGNTGAARSNLFLQPYTKADGTKSAWAIMAYEESKGVGLGPPEETGSGEEPQDGTGYDPYETFPDEGKNAIYHSFDFQNPDVVSAGTILNLHETDGELIGEGEPVYVEEPPYLGSDLICNESTGECEYVPIPNPDAGEKIVDWKGDWILAYENARRPRFILQGKAAMGDSGTVLIVLYKEGEDGAGRPSDIMSRRCVAGATGNPYALGNFVPGAQNVSTVTSLEEWINPDSNPDAKGDGVKVCKWEQPVGNLDLKSGVNPYEDARAHRGGIRGDFVIMGYSFTPNWAASRNAHDKYDFYIRRSFDGGQNWTTDPASDVPVVHTDIFIDPEGVSGADLTEMGDDESEATKHYEVETTYGETGCEYEPGRNVSLLKNNKTSVIEPRIVAVPGTIKVKNDAGLSVWTGIAEDMQNPDVFYVAYGTATNLPDTDKTPEDLFFSFSTDKGTTLFEEEWVVNPDSEGNFPGETVTGWYRLAKGDQEQGEVQLRMTPNGERFYSVWLDEGDEGSDIMFRRIMPSEFPNNNLP